MPLCVFGIGVVVVRSIVVCSREASLPAAGKLLLLLMFVGHDDKRYISRESSVLG